MIGFIERIFNLLPISRGGTGASTKDGARTNIEAAASATATLSSFADIPTGYSNSGFYNVQYTGADADAPVTTSGPHWWNVTQFGHASRMTQIAADAYNHQGTIWYRKKHDSTWYGWYRLDGEATAVSVSVNTATSDSRITGTPTISCTRSGNVVQLYANITLNCSQDTFANGSSLDVYLTGLPKPVSVMMGSFYYSSGLYGTRLDNSTGQLKIRNTSGATVSSSALIAIFSFTYLTND